MRILNIPLKHGSIFETSIFYLPLGDSLYSLYTFMKTSIVIVNHQNRWTHMNTHQLVMFHLELGVSNFQHVYNPLPSGLGKVTQCQTPCHNPNFGVWFLHPMKHVMTWGWLMALGFYHITDFGYFWSCSPVPPYKFWILVLHSWNICWTHCRFSYRNPGWGSFHNCGVEKNPTLKRHAVALTCLKPSLGWHRWLSNGMWRTD